MFAEYSVYVSLSFFDKCGIYSGFHTNSVACLSSQSHELRLEERKKEDREGRRDTARKGERKRKVCGVHKYVFKF